MKINIFWFRRDLRLEDNTALYYALHAGLPIVPIFIFDKNILDKLDQKADARVQFIHNCIIELNEELNTIGCALQIFYNTPENVFKNLIQQYEIQNVFANNDYESYAKLRDENITSLLNESGANFISYKDHVIFEKDEVLKDDNKPYTVFTPYSKKWKQKLVENSFEEFDTTNYGNVFFKSKPVSVLSLKDIGFERVEINYPLKTVEAALVKNYASQRDIPSIAGTSHLGLHLRFGTISTRRLAKYASKHSETFLNELIWRDFYHCITWHFPHVCIGKSFKPAYDNIVWRNDEAAFNAWCNGQTGYPIVDAGMRELNATGFMHNRVRMIVASFLCKHLLLDWRLGEAYFAEKLLDFDFAANNGGWQWAAGCGCDAAPYFRIFNPYLQTKKFDPEFKYIKKWVPEFEEFNYSKPIVDHTFARERCLKVYKEGLAAI